MHDNVNYNGPMELAFALPPLAALPSAPCPSYESPGTATVSAGPAGAGQANTKARQTRVIGKDAGSLEGK